MSEPIALVAIESYAIEETSLPCSSCTSWARARYRFPGLPGAFCSVMCAETELLGHQACRWCGRKMDNAYTSIESRLCSEDCRANYFARVMGDKSAKLGSGVRLVAFLQNQAQEKAARNAERQRRFRVLRNAENG